MTEHGKAPDERDIDDIDALERCRYCGVEPVPVVLVDGSWECYGCGHDPEEEHPNHV